MSLSTFPFEFYCVRKLIDYSTLISTNANEDSKLQELDVLITKTLKLFETEITDLPSLPNVNILVSLLEELINNLNEVNTSLIKALPNFDEKILPLFAKYAEVVIFQARSSASEKEYNQYKENFEEFLTNLSIHPTLQITPTERVKVLLSQLTTLVTSGSIEDVDETEQIPKKDKQDGFRNENKETCNKETEGDRNTEPITVVPETPQKNCEPACVGLAAIRGIIPLSSGCLFPFSTPPPDESGDVELPSQLQSIENPTGLHTPPPVMLSKLQKKLRSRFPIPHVVTPSEKNTQRSIMRILRSQRRRKPSPWNIFDSRSPSRAFSLRRRPLFLETESEILDNNSSSSQLALYLSPDVKNDAAPSFLPTASPKNLCDEERQTPMTSSEIVKSPGSSQKSPLFEENEKKMNLSSDKWKNAETYDELQKSIEGNLMGCEASPSDVELMDEIESSLNQEGEEKDLSYQESLVFMDPITIATKTNDFAEIRSQFLSESTTNTRSRNLRNSSHTDDSESEKDSSKLKGKNGVAASKSKLITTGMETVAALSWEQQCKDLLEDLNRSENAAPFREPVNILDWPDYLQVIDHPMDLQTVREQLQLNNYATPSDFAKDVRLIFQNSKEYNTNKKSRIYSMTVRLSLLFEERIKGILTSYEQKKTTASSESKSPCSKDTKSRKGKSLATTNSEKSGKLANGVEAPRENIKTVLSRVNKEQVTVQPSSSSQASDSGVRAARRRIFEDEEADSSSSHSTIPKRGSANGAGDIEAKPGPSGLSSSARLPTTNGLGKRGLKRRIVSDDGEENEQDDDDGEGRDHKISDPTKSQDDLTKGKAITNTPDSVKSSEKKSSIQSSQERRRSSRLAGVPVLSLKYRTEPLPDCRRASTKNKGSFELESDTCSSPSKKLPSVSAVSDSPVVRNSVPISPVPAQIQPSPAKVSVHTPIIPQLTWQEVRLLLPPCWANILDGHIKTHHPDELLRYGNGERCPTVYCNCTARQSRYSIFTSQCTIEAVK